MVFQIVVEVVFLIMALLFAIGSVGAKDYDSASRCMCLSMMFTAVVAIMIIAKK